MSTTHRPFANDKTVGTDHAAGNWDVVVAARLFLPTFSRDDSAFLSPAVARFHRNKHRSKGSNHKFRSSSACGENLLCAGGWEITSIITIVCDTMALTVVHLRSSVIVGTYPFGPPRIGIGSPDACTEPDETREHEFYIWLRLIMSYRAEQREDFVGKLKHRAYLAL